MSNSESLSIYSFSNYICIFWRKGNLPPLLDDNPCLAEKAWNSLICFLSKNAPTKSIMLWPIPANDEWRNKWSPESSSWSSLLAPMVTSKMITLELTIPKCQNMPTNWVFLSRFWNSLVPRQRLISIITKKIRLKNVMIKKNDKWIQINKKATGHVRPSTPPLTFKLMSSIWSQTTNF